MKRRSYSCLNLWTALRALSLAVTLLAPHSALALDEEGGAWFLATTHGSIGGNWKLYLEAQPRVDKDGMDQLLLRPAVGYQVTPNWSLWQGYAWTPSFHPNKDENRIFQQSVVELPRDVLPVTLINRTRLEERWIEGANGVSVRLRHMLRAVYPLNDDGSWALAAYDEPFVTLNDTNGGPVSGFNQNRAFIGINHLLMKGLRVEVGYLNQYLHRSGKEDGMNNNAVLALDYTW